MASFVFSPEFDHVFLESMYDNDMDYAGEVFSGFLTETKREFDTLTVLHSNNNVTGFRQVLHKIKPTFSFVGLTGLTERCEELISLCDKITEISAADPLWTKLSADIVQSFDLVEKELIRMKKHSS